MLNPRKVFKPIFALFLTAFLITSHAATLAGQKASASGPVASEPNGKFELTIDNIMRGPGLVGYEPRGVRWSADGQRIYFQWKRAAEPREKDFDTYVVGRDGA